MEPVRSERTSPDVLRPTAKPLSVAVLVTDDVSHGLNRYARVLADGLRRAGHEVRTTTLARDRPIAAARAAWRVRGTDVVHLQFTDRYLGSSLKQAAVALGVRAALLGTPLVVTAHDFHTPRVDVLAARRLRRRNRHRLVRKVLADAGFDLTAALLLHSATGVLTCSERERTQLGWSRPRRTAVVPHYVEQLPGTPPPDDDVDEHRIVVAGFIHRRKGQHLAVAALAHLPEHHLVLAGSATGRNTGYLAEVLRLARDLGVADRVEVTGYLPEEEMTRVLRSARVALAPYQRIAASGSIATLIAAGTPLVARRSEYTAELAAACPAAVQLFDGGEDGEEPASIARAVRRSLAQDLPRQRWELRERARDLAPDVIARRHVEAYTSMTGASPATRHGDETTP